MELIYEDRLHLEIIDFYHSSLTMKTIGVLEVSWSQLIYFPVLTIQRKSTWSNQLCLLCSGDVHFILHYFPFRDMSDPWDSDKPWSKASGLGNTPESSKSPFNESDFHFLSVLSKDLQCCSYSSLSSVHFVDVKTFLWSPCLIFFIASDHPHSSVFLPSCFRHIWSFTPFPCIDATCPACSKSWTKNIYIYETYLKELQNVKERKKSSFNLLVLSQMAK